MSDSSPEVNVRDHPDLNRYEARLGDEVVGIATYQREAAVITFLHTGVPQAYGGRGIGTALVRASLDDVRLQGLTVRPVCSFYVDFFDRHPAYADLLAADRPDRTAAG